MGDIYLDCIRLPFAGKRLLVAQGVRVPQAGMSTLVGANGSGKSTFLRFVAGLVFRGHGTITVGDDSWTQLSASDRARRGLHLQCQSPQLFEQRSIGENLLARRELSVRHPDIAAENAAAAVLGHLGTSCSLSSSAARLSGGQRKVVALACSILSGSAILLLDEPFASLSDDVARHLAVALAEFARASRCLVLVVSHVDVVSRTEALCRFVISEEGSHSVLGTR